MGLGFGIECGKHLQAAIRVANDHPEHQIRTVMAGNDFFDAEVQSRPPAPVAQCAEGAESVSNRWSGVFLARHQVDLTRQAG